MSVKPVPAERLPSQEALLLDYVQRLDRHREGRRGVHIHLSQLRPHHRREQHLRVARSTFENLVRAFEGQLFALTNADLVFIGKNVKQSEIDAAVLKLKYLFSEDPIVQNEGAQEPDKFCTWYDIERQHDVLLAAAERISAEAKRRNEQATATPPEARAPALGPLEPEQLARVESALGRADITNVIRRQSVCVVMAGAPPQIVFRELFVSIADLQRVVSPKTNLASNRWLFQHLTETLDKRMLATVPKLGDSSLESKFSLNLNVATLLSQEFLTFDATLRSTTRGTLVIELQPFDVFADLGTFYFARDFVRERGYRICLDGLSALTATMIDREKLGIDLMKIIWSADLADDAKGRRTDELKTMVRRIGESRVILCRCDNEEAIQVGHSLGITVFQGRHIETLLNNGKQQARA